MPRIAGLTPFRFRMALVTVLAVVFAALQFSPASTPRFDGRSSWLGDGRIHVFFHPECPHCHEAIAFLRQRPEIAFDLHDVSSPENETLLVQVAVDLGIPLERLGVPLFVRGSRFILGFDSPETTGRDILALAADGADVAGGEAGDALVDLPLIGKIDPSGYSLLALTALMGLSDGFNPCAMWVLVYLISLIAGIQDQRKVWWLVGTFVVASGVLYFLFMTAWLNTFLLVGYVRPLTQAIALTAIGFGADHLFGLAVNRGVIVCEVGDVEQRRQTMQWVRRVVAAPVGIGSLVLILGLAFTVNSIEFLCSAALPAIYTHVLTLSDLSTVSYYGYISLYVAFFMLDDLIIFGFAAFAAQRIVDTRYAAISRFAGGVVLLGLGIWMLWH